MRTFQGEWPRYETGGVPARLPTEHKYGLKLVQAVVKREWQEGVGTGVRNSLTGGH